MAKSYLYTVLGAAAIAAVASTAQAAIGSTVNVMLWDKGSAAAMVSDKGIGMTGDKTPMTMGVRLSTNYVKAGEVTFKVTNATRETVHELVVFPYKDGENIPYSEKDAKINEDSAGHLGEVSELEPSKSGELKISLKPGKYALLCNIPGHYMNGMWSILTVK